MIPDELYYTKEHEWVKVEGEEALIGITFHAQEELGDLVYVELPEIGTDVVRAQAIATVESVKAVADIYAPVSGTILASNELLLTSPEKLNEDPYGEGWIARIRIQTPEEVESLLSAEEYAAYLSDEGDR